MYKEFNKNKGIRELFLPMELLTHSKKNFFAYNKLPLAATSHHHPSLPIPPEPRASSLEKQVLIHNFSRQ